MSNNFLMWGERGLVATLLASSDESVGNRCAETYTTYYKYSIKG